MSEPTPPPSSFFRGDSPLRVAQAAQAYAESVVNTVREPLLILRADLRVDTANRAFYRTFRVTPEATIGRLVYELGNGQWDIPALRDLLENILPRNTAFDDYEVAHDFPTLGRRVMLLNARRLYREGNHTEFILLAIEDVTERRAAEEARRADYDRLQAELAREWRITEALQRPLLLETAEDAFPGLKVVTLYSAASTEAEVGGDFHGAFALADGRIALAVGDATGKGLGAAVRAAETRDVLRALMRLYPPYPAPTLTHLNDYLCDARALDSGREDDKLMALAVAVVNVARSSISCAWASMDPPVVLRADGRTETLRGGGIPLGVRRQEVYAEVTTAFRPGDTLLLTTDGLTEARRGRDFLGLDGVVALLQGARDLPTLRDEGLALLDGARTFAGGPLRDDACLVLVRRR